MSNNDDFLQNLEEFANEENTRVWSESHMEGYSDFYKDSEESKVWWIEKMDIIGEHLFSFDRKKIYNLFADYPYNLTS